MLLIPVVVLRCGDPVDRDGPQLGLFRTASCPIERGEREPSAAPAVRRSRGRRRSSRRRPSTESLCVRHFPRFFAHSRPPSGRWYQGGIAGQQACSKKVGPADAPRSGGAKPLGRVVQRWSKPLARRPQRAVEPLGRVVQRCSRPLAWCPRLTMTQDGEEREARKPLGRVVQRCSRPLA